MQVSDNASISYAGEAAWAATVELAVAANEFKAIKRQGIAHFLAFGKIMEINLSITKLASCSGVISTENPPLQATPASQNVRDQNPKRDGPRHVPTEAELGSEREIKWGVNIPNTAEQLVEEAKYVGCPDKHAFKICYRFRMGAYHCIALVA